MAANAQLATLTLKDGTISEVKIQANSSSTIWVMEGQIQLSVIQSISFTEKDSTNTNLYNNLEEAGIAIFFDGVTRTEPPLVVVPKPIVPTKVALNLDNDLEHFRKQRTLAKSFELVGILAIGGSVALQAIFNNQFKKDFEDWSKNPTTAPQPEAKYVPAAIPLIGLGVFTVGISIDLSAGKKLK